MLPALASGERTPALPTCWDGIWWAFTTITTMSYGDIAPATTAGRVVAIAIIVIGLGIVACSRRLPPSGSSITSLRSTPNSAASTSSKATLSAHSTNSQTACKRSKPPFSNGDVSSESSLPAQHPSRRQGFLIYGTRSPQPQRCSPFHQTPLTGRNLERVRAASRGRAFRHDA
jgi:hypothetical protein